MKFGNLAQCVDNFWSCFFRNYSVVVKLSPPQASTHPILQHIVVYNKMSKWMFRYTTLPQVFNSAPAPP